ncbi:MAG: shikimate dehydrogenase [Oscillospiraceae bacterium]|nr:shikimate dehydrogenase [Oscillospiraceae bacterium]
MKENYTLIGYPLGHSMSPWIHERLFRLSGKEADYTLTEIPPETLEQHMTELKNLKGFNITIPYKTKIIPFLDKLDKSAELYHSVNCVANGTAWSIGYNTDCEGFTRSVPSLNGKILLIGCGGVGRMMAIEAVIRGAELTISEPNQEKATALSEEIHALKPSAKIRLADASQLEEAFDLIMNASPVGMFPNIQNCPVKDSLIQKCSPVFDVIYNPTETLLMKKARSFGKTAVGGSAMLVWQAVRAHEIWYNSRFQREDIENLISEMNQEINRLFPIKKEHLL